MKKKLRQEFQNFVNLILNPPDRRLEEVSGVALKQGFGSISGDTFISFERIVQSMLKDRRVNHLERRDLEDRLWDFFKQIKENPEHFKKKSDDEISRFYKTLIKKDNAYEILLPIQNVTLSENLVFSEFSVIEITDEIIEDWGPERGEKWLQSRIGKTAILTNVQANTYK